MSTNQTPLPASTASPKFVDVLASAVRTPAQAALAEIENQLALVERQRRASAKTIRAQLDNTIGADGKSPLLRAQILAEAGNRQSAIQAALDQIGVPPPPTPKAAQESAPAKTAPIASPPPTSPIAVK